MDDQASMKDGVAARASRNGPAPGPEGGVAEFISDLIELAELQAELAVVNSREAARKALAPLGVVVFSLAILAGGATVCLMGSASLLASALEIHQGWAMLATAGVAMTLASLAVGLGIARLKSSFATFRASRQELRRNLAWLRNELVSRRHAFLRRGN